MNRSSSCSLRRPLCGLAPRLRRLVPALLVALGTLPAGGLPVLEAATVERVRHSSTPERTRIVLDLSEASAYTHRPLADPPRVVVELVGGHFAAGVGEKRIGDGYVSGLRTNTLRSGRIQVVVDLESALDYSTFTLEDPPRIVIDVAHGSAPPRAAPPPATEERMPSPKRPDPQSQTPPPPEPVIPPPVRETWVVAVDAGHGGQDHRARHHGHSEKDITLALAREVERELNRRPGIRAFLVRKGDYFIPLRRRWTLAEKQGADLFVSLHCNASTRREAAGTEVFFLSLKGATDEAARELAQRENSVDERMGVASGESELDEIIFDMRQADALTKSEILAESCLTHLFELGTVYDRGVKQAGFAVLKSPRMPSILVEAAFISNRTENAMLRDRGWQRRFGERMADGVHAYVQSVAQSERAERQGP